jgi:hypothetical protein
VEQENIFKKLRLVDVFTFNLELLSYRINKFSDMKSINYNKFEKYTYFDAIIVQIRAMFLEKKSNNFTFQLFLKSEGRIDLAEKVNAYFDEPFDATDIEARDNGDKFRSIRNVIKFIDYIDQGEQNYLVNILLNPYNNRYLPKLINEVLLIVKEAKIN